MAAAFDEWMLRIYCLNQDGQDWLDTQDKRQ